jgi:hypothetical protein
MDYKKLLQSALPYVLSVILFAIISYTYFSPLMEGKDLPQMDNTHAIGMSKELVDFEKANPGEVALWTNSAFGGMPAYQIKGGPPRNVFYYINNYLHFGLPYRTVSIVFLYMLGFYILLLSMKVDKWLSFGGALIFAFASYNLIIISAGHITKGYAIGMMAPVMAGIILLYSKKYITGGIFTMVALGCEMAQNHVQITFYLGLLMIVFVVVKLIEAVLSKEYKSFILSSCILIAATILAVAPNTTNLWTTYEYGKESIRGETDLVKATQKKSSGLDRDYALAWSYGKKETLTLLIPNAVGGETSALGNVKSAMEKVVPEYKDPVSRQNQYWGEMPFTSGPVYVGSIICFLFILGLFVVNNSTKWWLLAATLLSIMLAWGKNFGFFTDLFFYYFPLYNKFRTVSMILVIAGATMPLLAFLALNKIITNPEIIKQQKRDFFIALGLTGGLSLLFALLPTLFFSFLSSEESQWVSEQIAKATSPEYATQFNEFVANLELARISIFRADALRSVFFIVVTGGIIWYYSIKPFNKMYIIAAITFLMVVDVWMIAKRYLNSDQFVKKTVVENQFTPTNADNFILKYKLTDPNADLNFRVFNISRNPFTEVNTSYFNNSIGGYHGAKLRRYQDLIDSVLTLNISQIQAAVQSKDSIKNIYATLSNMGVLNMLNTKYIIADPNQMPIFNFSALGNAWFVYDFQLVDDANQELAAIKNFDPATTAVIDKKFASYIEKIPKLPNDTIVQSQIKLIKYKPHELTYQVFARRTELAVFAEIYYDKGWNAYIDGVKTDHFRANYVLRAMVIPEGKHLIEFKFEPQSFAIGQKIATSSSILVIILILGFLIKLFLDEKKRLMLEPVKQLQEIKAPVETIKENKHPKHHGRK